MNDKRTALALCLGVLALGINGAGCDIDSSEVEDEVSETFDHDRIGGANSARFCEDWNGRRVLIQSSVKVSGNPTFVFLPEFDPIGSTIQHGLPPAGQSTGLADFRWEVHCDDEREYVQIAKHVPGTTSIEWMSNKLGRLATSNNRNEPETLFEVRRVRDHNDQPVDGVYNLHSAVPHQGQFPSMYASSQTSDMYVSPPFADLNPNGFAFRFHVAPCGTSSSTS